MRTSVIILATLCLSACATTGASRTGTVDASQDQACLTSTGSRVAAVNGSCAGIGQTISAGDIAKTGATTPGEALRLLSPSLTINH